MAAVKSKKDTKAPVKKTPVKKAAAQKVVVTEDAESGSKRKRVTFSKKLTEDEPNKKAATTKSVAKPTKPVAKPTKKVVTTKKETIVEADSEDEEEKITTTEIVEEEELTEEQEEAFRKEILGDIASSSEGEDSSDEETDAIDANSSVVALDAEKLLESMTETKKIFDKKSGKSKTAKTEEKGVIYLGRIPHGFYENEMKGYFSQFGDITRLRLSRNKKTGASKHYAFIEFASEDVAQIVTETMDNYLLFENLLKCKLIPSEKVHEKLFVGANKTFKPLNNVLLNRQRQNKALNADQLSAKHEKLKLDEQAKRDKLKEAGIDYDFPGYA